MKVVFVRIREKEFREDFILYIYIHTYKYIYTHITYITQEMHRFYRTHTMHMTYMICQPYLGQEA